MYSQEQVNDFAKEFMEPRIQNNVNQLKMYLSQKDDQVKDGLLLSADRLFKKCIRQQQEGMKEPIRYIHFFYLNLAVITGQYDIQLNAFSKQSYMDKTESMELWNPSFVMDLYKKDMEDLEQEAKRQVIRFGYPQMMELKKRLYTIYARMAGRYLVNAAEGIAGLPSFCEMEKEEGIQMVFGGYMDTGFQIWPASLPEGAAKQEERA